MRVPSPTITSSSSSSVVVGRRHSANTSQRPKRLRRLAVVRQASGGATTAPRCASARRMDGSSTPSGKPGGRGVKRAGPTAIRRFHSFHCSSSVPRSGEALRVNTSGMSSGGRSTDWRPMPCAGTRSASAGIAGLSSHARRTNASSPLAFSATTRTDAPSSDSIQQVSGDCARSQVSAVSTTC